MADRDQDSGDVHVRDQLAALNHRLDRFNETSGALAETMDDVEREWTGVEREWERLKRTLRWGLVFFVVSITLLVTAVLVLASALL